jgi:DNA-binding NarL/FixJ family response regulator
MGMDVLGWIQEQGHLAHLAVIMLTSSSDISDVDRAYSLGANSYIVKPVSLAKRIEIARTIKQYWLELNEFPSSAATPCPVAKPRQATGRSTSRR